MASEYLISTEVSDNYEPKFVSARDYNPRGIGSDTHMYKWLIYIHVCIVLYSTTSDFDKKDVMCYIF